MRQAVQVMLKKQLSTAVLALGVLFMVGPARVDPAAAAIRPADGLVQTIQYDGRPGYYGRHRFYGRPHFYGRSGFYGRPRYYERPRFYRPERGYYGRRGYYR